MRDWETGGQGNRNLQALSWNTRRNDLAADNNQDKIKLDKNLIQLY